MVMVGLVVLDSCLRQRSGQERENQGLARRCRGIASYSGSSSVVKERSRSASEGMMVAGVCSRRQKGGFVNRLEHNLYAPSGNGGANSGISMWWVMVTD